MKDILAFKYFFAFLLSFIPLSILPVQAVNAADLGEEILTQPSINNFQKVSKTIWRGGVPSDEAIQDLASKGVKTLIDLRKDGSGVEHEKLLASKLGLNYVHISMGFGKPSTQAIITFLQTINNEENQPVFIHCHQGADRTGTLIGIYRIVMQQWPYEKVYSEMRSHHFKPWLLTMRKTVSTLAHNNHSQDIYRAIGNLNLTSIDSIPLSAKVLPDTNG